MSKKLSEMTLEELWQLFPIILAEPQPQWAEWYSAKAHELHASFPECRVHHIGSTAIHGIWAKPIIDILVSVKDLRKVDDAADKMADLGYEALGEYGIPGRRFFRKGGEQPTHHVHVFENSTQSEIQRHLAVVEYLSSHERRREEYSELKMYLSEAYPEDIEGYMEGKAYFVSQLEQEALNSREEAQEEEESAGRSVPVSLGMGIGLVLGLTVFNNIGIGLCVGLCLAMAASKLKKD